MSEKRCSRCSEVKPSSEFYKHPQTRDGIAPSCKKCDNSRQRKPTGAKINRMRARHRAVADLISMYADEFAALLAIRLAEATDEAEVLAAEPAAKEHYQSEPVRLRPGKRMPGQSAGDRIDVARCPHCIKHHDRGHVCAACGAAPGNNVSSIKILVSSPPKPAPSGVRPRQTIDADALDAFNRGTDRARRAAR